MINLSVADYCHDCIEFEADVVGAERFYEFDTPIYQSDTIVQCQHKEKCARIAEYLKTQKL